MDKIIRFAAYIASAAQLVFVVSLVPSTYGWDTATAQSNTAASQDSWDPQRILKTETFVRPPANVERIIMAPRTIPEAYEATVRDDRTMHDREPQPADGFDDGGGQDRRLGQGGEGCAGRGEQVALVAQAIAIPVPVPGVLSSRAVSIRSPPPCPNPCCARPPRRCWIGTAPACR